MQGSPEAGTFARAIHVLDHVVHSDDVRARQISRYPKKMGNMNQFALQPLDDAAKFKVASQGVIGLEKSNGIEVRRQRTDLRHLLRRADQKIFVGVIEPAQGADDVPGVGADAELSDTANVNGDLHAMI